MPYLKYLNGRCETPKSHDSVLVRDLAASAARKKCHHQPYSPTNKQLLLQIQRDPEKRPIAAIRKKIKAETLFTRSFASPRLITLLPPAMLESYRR
jgi:hypothetical protein